MSFAALPDAKERDYLNQQPTSFVLPPEAVDRLRAAAGTIIQASPEFQRLLKDVGLKVVAEPSAEGGTPVVDPDEFCEVSIGRAESRSRTQVALPIAAFREILVRDSGRPMGVRFSIT